MDAPIRLGKIAFLNLHPIFEALVELYPGHRFEIVESYPAELNRLLRNGIIDISPSSSVEYLRAPDEYTYLPGHSISSRGPVRSIYLLSRVPIEDLDGHQVMVTHQSATSVALLNVLLSRYYNVKCELKTSASPVLDAIASHTAHLSIGDEALMLGRRLHYLDAPCERFCRLCSINHQVFYLYDLGELWFRHTGLPMVFALWIMKKSASQAKRARIEELKEMLDAARALAVENFERYAARPGLILPPEEAVAYWKTIVYDLDGDCVKGLDLFGSLIDK